MIAFGMALTAIGFWTLFHPPDRFLVSWFAASVFLCTTGFSIVSINFYALGGLWEATPSGRTRITGWREAAGLAGLLLASVAPTALGSDEDPDGAFHLLTLAFVPMLAAAGAFLFGWMSRARIGEPAAAGGRMTTGLGRALSAGWNRAFFSIYLLNGFAGSMSAVLVVFFVTDRLQAGGLLGAFLLAYFASGAASMPAWRMVSERIGKERAWMWGMWLAVATFSWASFLEAGDVAAYAAVCALSGLALGADLSLPPSVLADRIARRGEEDIASTYFSALTFSTKAALALATGITLPALGALGYRPGDAAGGDAAVYLSAAYAAVPCALKAAAALCLLAFIRAGQGAGSENQRAGKRIHAGTD